MLLFADAQTTFYVVGVVFMIFWMMIGLIVLVGILTVAAKVRTAQKRLKAKIDLVSFWTGKGKGFFDSFMRGLNR